MQKNVQEDYMNVIADAFGVPNENVVSRQDADYMVAEVLINTECVGTTDDLEQIRDMTGFKYDSFRVNPAQGVILIFIKKLYFTDN